jgi:glyoxylase-like metal-dependent hydrolase (beta-lactamase superfamily II)
MVEPQVFTVARNVRLLRLKPPIPGYNDFIGPYLISGERIAVIDIGPAAALPSFLSALGKLGKSPDDVDYIIFTHIHIDHAGSAGGAARALPRAMILAHSRAHEHLVNPQELWAASLNVLGDYAVKSGPIESVPEDRIIDAEDGMKLNLGPNLSLEIYLTPGHAVHHLSLFYGNERLLFAGEAAGVCINGAVRLATPPPFKLEVTLSSIDKLMKLKPNKICYSHFGCYDNAIDRLKLYRNKVATWYQVVNSAAEKSKNLEEILKALREEDAELNYLDKLDKKVYSREVSLIYNTIRGLAGSNLKYMGDSAVIG